MDFNNSENTTQGTHQYRVTNTTRVQLLQEVSVGSRSLPLGCLLGESKAPSVLYSECQAREHNNRDQSRLCLLRLHHGRLYSWIRPWAVSRATSPLRLVYYLPRTWDAAARARQYRES